MRRALVPSSALLSGLQFALLNPALALLLVAVFGASASEVGWVLAAYNASGFVASLALPVYADRHQDYLGPMLACGVLGVAMALLLLSTPSLPVVVAGLVTLGAPAGVGISLLFAQLNFSGARPADVVNTRAVVSFAWVVGPPLAALLVGWAGNHALLLALVTVAVLNLGVTAGLLGVRRRARRDPAGEPVAPFAADSTMSRSGVALVVAAFVALQATNSAVVAIMALYVTRSLGLDVIWAGLSLGVAAALEIPALLVLARLEDRFSSLALIGAGCVAGIAYYAVMVVVSGPVLLLAAQVLNAWFFATIAGVGITLFQQVIPRPGLATGLYTNTRRIGAILSGPIIALGTLTARGYAGVFVVCVAMTLLATGMLGVAHTANRSVREAHRTAGDSAPRC